MLKGVKVKDFYLQAKSKIPIEIVAENGGMWRMVYETTVNRPALAIAGFYEHFAHRRIQVLGMAEYDFLASKNESEQKDCFRQLFGKKIPCLVLCRNKRAYPEMLEIARQYRIPIFRTPLITREFINSATLVMENIAAPTQHIQGTMVDIKGMGVLIEGVSGIGKSEAAITLVMRGHSLVSDDVTIIKRTGERTLIGYAPEAIRYHLELRGVGIIHVPSLFGIGSVCDEKQLDMIVSLKKSDDAENIENRDISMAQKTRVILGVNVPYITLPVAAGRELANMIEVAALNAKLLKLGHDAAKELDAKLMKRLLEKGKEA
jgi:HPr kinase/phosphorylase